MGDPHPQHSINNILDSLVSILSFKFYCLLKLSSSIPLLRIFLQILNIKYSAQIIIIRSYI